MVAAESSLIDPKGLANRLRIGGIGATTETAVLALFVAGLAWVPFLFGSNRLIAWGINAVVFPALVLLYELSLIVRRAPHPVAIRCIRLSAILFALATTWALVQNATWTPAKWQHPIWQLASDVLGRQIPGSISVDPDLTALALIRLMAAASVFWLALQLGRDARRGRLLLWSVVGIAALYALVGLFAPGGSNAFVVYSTFANPDHYATFAGIGLLSAVALIQSLYRRALRDSGDLFRLKLAALIDTTGGKAAVPLALAFLMLVTVFLTWSRGGIIATAVGLLALFVLSAKRASRFGRNEVIIGVFAALLLGAAFVGFGDSFVKKITTNGIYDEGRLMTYIISIRSILSAPVLGYGYGTFSSVFPMFRDDSLSVDPSWDKLHNTYLEIFQGLGLVFGTMLMVSVLLLVLRCLKGATSGRRGATIPAAAASASFLVGAHAFVDFSLQIQAVTLTYMAVLGAGVAQAADS